MIGADDIIVTRAGLSHVSHIPLTRLKALSGSWSFSTQGSLLWLTGWLTGWLTDWLALINQLVARPIAQGSLALKREHHP